VLRGNLLQVNNNQETNRAAVSELVDERTRFEMYYPPFAGAVKAGLASIMCSYLLWPILA
jgi:beta-glucosidase